MKNYFAIQMKSLPEEEITNTLSSLAERITDSIETDYCITIRNSNGNVVGTATRLDLIQKPVLSDPELGDFNLLIECENAAFFDHDGESSNYEISRIIKGVASRFNDLSKEGKEAINLKDINGNTVGSVQRVG